MPPPMTPPIPPTLLFVPEIRALLEEGRELTPEDYRRIAITMRVALTTTTTSDNNTYKVPSTHKLLITGIQGHLAGMVSTDSAIGTGNLTTAAGELFRWKAQNCRVTLINADDSTNILGENQAMSLATLLPSANGQPLDWRNAPHIVLPAATIQMTATLISTVAAQVGSSTEYGVTIDGVLVRVKRS